VADAAAWRFWNRARRADLAEVKAVAYLGLCQAAERFPAYQAEHGYPLDDHRYLVAFISRRVNGAIIDWARAADHVTRSQRQRLKQLEDCAEPGASTAELAGAAGLTEAQVRDAQAAQAARPVSLDGPAGPDMELVADGAARLTDLGEDVESVVVVSGILRAVLRAVSALSWEQQLLLKLRYFEGRSVADAAEALSLELSHARHLHEAAILAVHDVMLAAASA
jgi:DNA-directed RNA polymerase specialized sigma subunit